MLNEFELILFFFSGGGADGFTISGLSAFLPKYLQSQYGFSAGIAAAIVGLLVIPAGGEPFCAAILRKF